MARPKQQVGTWNLANALTAVRLVLVPVFGWLLLHGDGDQPAWRLAAAAVFAIAVVTDRLDGEIARSRGLITDVGAIADPIADKALIGTALVGLSLLGELAWWVTVVVLVREIGITAMRLVVIRHGVLPAGRGGKAKTVVQSVAVVLLVAPLTGSAHAVAQWVMAVAVVLTVVTGVTYLASGWRLREGSERTRRRRASRRGDGA